ncbi:hypothetical protein C8R46DRAFT_310720 [Mycena filopes]|nr:hypothetical protein C8R46DRAFT_310720 [Mycena filopes]
MNTEQYATAIMDELRGWAQEWLQGLSAMRAMQTALGTDVPYPSYPLPIGFPLGDFTLTQGFSWTHVYGDYHQIRHTYTVDFILQGRTNGPGSSVAWSVVEREGGILLGILEIAGPIYDDAQLPFRIDTDLLLLAMAASLRVHTPIHLRSRVEVIAGPVVHPNNAGVPHPQRVYELRTAHQHVVCELGRRWGL